MSQVGIGEAFSGAITTMSDYVDEVTKKVEEIFEKFNECISQNTYKVLHDSAKSLESAYNETVLAGIKTSMKEWSDGEGSYVSQANRWSVGDDAIGVAQKQQDEIVEKIESIAEVTAISENSPDFLETHFDPEVVKGSLEEIAEFSKGLEEIAENKVAELEKQSEENSTIKTIVAAGVTYGKSISAFVQKTTEMVSNIISENLDRISEENQHAEEESKEQAEKIVQQMEEQTNNLTTVFDSLFE